MTETPETTTSRVRWEPYLAYAALLLIVLLIAAVRVRIRNLPLERDEGEYAYAGQLMLQGIPPYKLAYNMKLPGTYAAYALIMAVFGQTEAGIRTGLLLVNAACIVLVFFLAKRLQGLLAAVVAAATFGLLSARVSVLGIYGHATHFVTLAALAGILLLLESIDTNRISLLFASGLCFGTAFLMKQPGIAFGVFAALYWLWIQRRRPLRELAKSTALFSAAVALPFALTCLVLLAAGVFRNFWFWTFSYARAYGSINSFSAGLEQLRKVLPWILRPRLLWIIAALGLTAIFWNRKARAEAPFSLGFLFFSMLAVVPGFYFRPHYFIVMLPAVALWTGIAVSAGQQALFPRVPRAWLAATPVLVLALVLMVSHNRHLEFFFQVHALAANQQLDERTGFAEAKQVANYIQAHSSEQDPIAVLGSEPEIYFYSHRHSATGFIYTYALLEKQKFAPAMRQQMMTELQNAPAKYVVYVDNESSWAWQLNPPPPGEIFEPLEKFLKTQYDLERQVPIPGNSDHRWGTQASFYVFRRKASAAHSSGS